MILPLIFSFVCLVIWFIAYWNYAKEVAPYVKGTYAIFMHVLIAALSGGAIGYLITSVTLKIFS